MKLPSIPARVRQLAPLMLVLTSAAIAVAAYLQALNYPFVSDDENYIILNTKLAGLHLSELWRLFVEPYNDFSEFLPLRDLSYWFDITLFGLTPSALRIHNILLYLLCLPLVYGTTLGLWRYFRPADTASAPWAAAAVTALFAVNPVLVEAVVWISGRKYVLPNLFSMLALWFAVSARQERGLSPYHAAATLVAFVAMMLSKASYVTVAPAIAILWLLFWRDIPAQERRRSLLLWPLAILLLAAFLLKIFVASSTERAPAYFGVEVVTRTLAILGWLARLAVSPESRHIYYPVIEDSWLSVMAALGMTVLASAAWGVVMLLRRRSLVGFALVTFPLLCIPYLQIIPYDPPSLVSDRFLALAVWPVALLIVVLAMRLKPLPRIALLLVIALPWIFQTTGHSRDWRSKEALVDSNFRAYPEYYIPALYEIRFVQLPRGLNRDAGETASKISDPENRNIIIGLINADYAVRVNTPANGSPQEAMALLLKLGLALKQPPLQAKWNLPMKKAWDICKNMLASQWAYLAMKFPGDVSVRYNAGLWMLDAKKFEYAVDHLRAAVESQQLPESVRGEAFMNFGFALLNSGHIAEAEIPLRAALEQPKPDMRAHCLLSEIYRQTKRVDEAAHAEANCLKLAPGEGTTQ